MAAKGPNDAADLLSQSEFEKLPDDQKLGYEPIIRYKPKGFKEVTQGKSKGKFVPALMHTVCADGETCMAGEEA